MCYKVLVETDERVAYRLASVVPILLDITLR